jgi:hypothetical protein
LRQTGRWGEMKNFTKIRPVLAVVVLVLCTIPAFMFLGDSGVEVLETDTISWAAAAEKCKDKYKSLRPKGVIKVSNCRKRLWDDNFFYYYWSKPQSIFIKNSKGEKIRHKGTCQVDRKSGEIVYQTLNDTVLVNKLNQ